MCTDKLQNYTCEFLLSKWDDKHRGAVLFIYDIHSYRSIITQRAAVCSSYVSSDTGSGSSLKDVTAGRSRIALTAKACKIRLWLSNRADRTVSHFSKCESTHMVCNPTRPRNCSQHFPARPAAHACEGMRPFSKLLCFRGVIIHVKAAKIRCC